jgi:hypothetical protein
LIGFCGATAAAMASATAATSPTTPSGATNSSTGVISVEDAWVEIYDSSTALGADTSVAMARAVKSTAGATGTLQATTGSNSRHVLVAGAWKQVSG